MADPAIMRAAAPRGAALLLCALLAAAAAAPAAAQTVSCTNANPSVCTLSDGRVYQARKTARTWPRPLSRRPDPAAFGLVNTFYGPYFAYWTGDDGESATNTARFNAVDATINVANDFVTVDTDSVWATAVDITPVNPGGGGDPHLQAAG
ncbi:MAG: hypothetical protein J3K34DRAFT_235450 [Monoraphidium minutum]|nr:MAG: hypothetical protein J3K34DRAFT_235450 [Monoraphidium minutum]